MEKLEQIILSIVSNEQGIKELALIVKIIEEYSRNNIKPFPSDIDIMTVLDNLVKREKIIALNYILAKHPNKLKTIYFENGTKIL